MFSAPKIDFVIVFFKAGHKNFNFTYFPNSHKGYKPFCTMTLITQIIACASIGYFITVPYITCGESRAVTTPSRSFHYRLSAENYRRWQNQDWSPCTIRVKNWSLLQMLGWVLGSAHCPVQKFISLRGSFEMFID